MMIQHRIVDFNDTQEIVICFDFGMSTAASILNIYYCPFILCLPLSLIITMGLQFIQMQNSNPILILGGSNFMGKSLIDIISKNMPSHKVYMINRGKIYWYLKNQQKEQLNIEFFYGDRNEHKEMSKAINYLNEKNGISESFQWAAVIDFTSFKWRDVQSIARPLQNKTELYLFISTDSIYNNTPFDGVKIKESKHDLEQMYKQQKGKKISDKYGYDKLKCQIYLKRRKHLPYINLRLPDVLGPYDNTSRFWCSLQWVKDSHRHPIHLNSKDMTKKLSFVYSKDVSQLIIRLIKNRSSVQKYKSYNLSFLQQVTNKQFLQEIGNSLKKPIDPKFVHIDKQQISDSLSSDSNKQSDTYYPSVNYTCIDCNLAIQELNWTPSTLNECIKATTEFFQLKAYNYETQLKQMKKELKKKVID